MILYNAIYFVRQCIWIETLETCTIQANALLNNKFYGNILCKLSRSSSPIRWEWCARARAFSSTNNNNNTTNCPIHSARESTSWLLLQFFIFSFSFSAWFSLILLCNLQSHVGITFRSRKQLSLSLDQWNCTSMAKNKNWTNQQQIIEMNLIRHKFDNLKRMTRLWWLTWYIAYGRF